MVKLGRMTVHNMDSISVYHMIATYAGDLPATLSVPCFGYSLITKGCRQVTSRLSCEDMAKEKTRGHQRHMSSVEHQVLGNIQLPTENIKFSLCLSADHVVLQIGRRIFLPHERTRRL